MPKVPAISETSAERSAAVRRKWLTEAERDWLKAYNRVVYRMLKNRLSPEVAKWLKKKCR